jgi:hypothetical protein
MLVDADADARMLDLRVIPNVSYTCPRLARMSIEEAVVDSRWIV